jgi:hypothetical protein
VKNTFLNKVQAERRVLSMVNRRLGADGQLAGLSGGAIEDWQRRANMSNGAAIVATLRSLGELCQTLSDRSHETFRPTELTASKSIEVACELLDRQLNVAFASDVGRT